MIIDSLGSFHYMDKYEFDSGLRDSSTMKQSIELVLARVLEPILSLRKVVVYVSKSCLFDEVKLDIPWPFPRAGVPSMPKDFMPDLWKNLTSHIILMYHIESTSSDYNNGARRGVVAMYYKDPQKNLIRKPVVGSASLATINNDGLFFESLHVAG